jgi:hypothetical protein
VKSPKSHADRAEAIRRLVEDLLREMEGVEDLRRETEEAVAAGHLTGETAVAVMEVVEAAEELRRTVMATMGMGTAPDTTIRAIPAKVIRSK